MKEHVSQKTRIFFLFTLSVMQQSILAFEIGHNSNLNILLSKYYTSHRPLNRRQFKELVLEYYTGLNPKEMTILKVEQQDKNKLKRVDYIENLVFEYLASENKLLFKIEFIQDFLGNGILLSYKSKRSSKNRNSIEKGDTIVNNSSNVGEEL